MSKTKEVNKIWILDKSRDEVDECSTQKDPSDDKMVIIEDYIGDLVMTIPADVLEDYLAERDYHKITMSHIKSKAFGALLTHLNGKIRKMSEDSKRALEMYGEALREELAQELKED
jgi:hypothetical protein